MKNNYIPEILKEKIHKTINFSYGVFLFLVSILSTLALITFNINDNSFLTSTSKGSENFLGDLGSYYASFLFYTFGIFAYLIIIFFLVYSLLVFFRKNPKYLFIRLLFFFISLIFIPQSLIHLNVELLFIESIETWGNFANQLYNLYVLSYLSHCLTFVGICIYLFSQNIFILFKIPRIKINNIFKINNQKNLINDQIKKEPIINNLHKDNFVEESNSKVYTENDSLDRKSKYFSPSLEILEADDSSADRSVDKKIIKENSDLLERVFQDFNIDIKVINVKLGPVVTLFEILPAAGIKINTIINLADDISRSMGVGAVRIAQIYGTQYLGVEVPNEERETVTIKELLSNNNFKNTTSKIPICIGKDISEILRLLI